jgi:hypothetical protein
MQYMDHLERASAGFAAAAGVLDEGDSGRLPAVAGNPSLTRFVGQP